MLLRYTQRCILASRKPIFVFPNAVDLLIHWLEEEEKLSAAIWWEGIQRAVIIS